MKAVVRSFVDIAPEIRHLTLEVEGIEHFSFVPGQFVSLSTSIDGIEYTRAYSIASPPNGNAFELCFNRVPAGHFSTFLFTLSPGDEIEFAPPLGYFTLRNRTRDMLMMCTGTGITPFRSMLLDGMRELRTDVTLLFGSRYPEGLLFAEEWRELERRHQNFHYCPTLTRPPETWDGRTGRVQTHLDEVLGGRTDIDVYLCGMAEMIESVRKMLKERGFDRKQIITEKYD